MSWLEAAQWIIAAAAHWNYAAVVRTAEGPWNWGSGPGFWVGMKRRLRVGSPAAQSNCAAPYGTGVQ